MLETINIILSHKYIADDLIKVAQGRSLYTKHSFDLMCKVIQYNPLDFPDVIDSEDLYQEIYMVWDSLLHTYYSKQGSKLRKARSLTKLMYRVAEIKIAQLLHKRIKSILKEKSYSKEQDDYYYQDNLDEALLLKEFTLAGLIKQVDLQQTQVSQLTFEERILVYRVLFEGDSLPVEELRELQFALL